MTIINVSFIIYHLITSICRYTIPDLISHTIYIYFLSLYKNNQVNIQLEFKVVTHLKKETKIIAGISNKIQDKYRCKNKIEIYISI
jgi:hypothetical protein